ncbi:hypothetical protein BDF14DRAFT_898202 [Spinellus fusiger]|nr:hypothetical protein BDF14DRAFT_898202 [Spinellus fusiger]
MSDFGSDDNDFTDDFFAALDKAEADATVAEPVFEQQKISSSSDEYDIFDLTPELLAAMDTVNTTNIIDTENRANAANTATTATTTTTATNITNTVAAVIPQPPPPPPLALLQETLHETWTDDEFGTMDDIDFEALAEMEEQVEQSMREKEDITPSMATTPSITTNTSRITSFITTTPSRIPPSKPSSSRILTTPHLSAVFGPVAHLEEDPVPPPPPAADTPCYHPFDPTTLPTWVYPINYSLRSYQYYIVKKALFTNTLVALPTGLGKTFIAAVVMLNYYRWFPSSKIIFMAPTRPLVAQQIEACFKVCGMSQEDTVDMTGSSTPPGKRKLLWRNKRVFFVTPQLLQNDIQSRTCPADQIVCVVVDEAHKATGQYAYTQVIKLIVDTHEHFRVLALTATPGTTIANVQVVLDNLRIAHIEIRTEDSTDIRDYSHGKNIHTIVVKLDYGAGATGVVPQAAKTFRDSVFTPVLKRLKKHQGIQEDTVERNTPYQLLMSRQQFNARAKNLPPAVRGMVQVDFVIAESLSRAFEMLCQHGVGPFLSSIDQTLADMQQVLDSGKHLSREKMKLLSDLQLKRLLDGLRLNYLQPGFVGHPKLDSLVHTVLQHFSDADESGMDDRQTKIIVFSSYRSSVDEIIKVLSQHTPLVRCMSFVGQANGKSGTKGLNQKEQQEVISKFQSGQVNVIVATSIGEEGLDIGEVDLIICYDSQSSPIRMLQRMGRTGRRRQGRCVLLMTDQEEKKYNSAKEAYSRVQKAITQRNSLEYFKHSPSVLPRNYHPVCSKQILVIGKYAKPALTEKQQRAHDKKTYPVQADGALKEDTLQLFLQRFSQFGRELKTIEDVRERYWPTKPISSRLTRYLPSNACLGPYRHIGHSTRTLHFTQLIKTMEYRILHPGESLPNPLTFMPKPTLATSKIKLPGSSSKKKEISVLSIPQPSAYKKQKYTPKKQEVDPFIDMIPLITRGILNDSDEEVENDWEGSYQPYMRNPPLCNDVINETDENYTGKGKGKEMPYSPQQEDYPPFTSKEDDPPLMMIPDDSSLDYEPILPDSPEIISTPLPPQTQTQTHSIVQDLYFNDILPPFPPPSASLNKVESLATCSTFHWNLQSPVFSEAAKPIMKKRQKRYEEAITRYTTEETTVYTTDPVLLSQDKTSPKVGSIRRDGCLDMSIDTYPDMSIDKYLDGLSEHQLTVNPDKPLAMIPALPLNAPTDQQIHGSPDMSIDISLDGSQMGRFLDSPLLPSSEMHSQTLHDETDERSNIGTDLVAPHEDPKSPKSPKSPKIPAFPTFPVQPSLFYDAKCKPFNNRDNVAPNHSTDNPTSVQLEKKKERVLGIDTLPWDTSFMSDILSVEGKEETLNKSTETTASGHFFSAKARQQMVVLDASLELQEPLESFDGFETHASIESEEASLELHIRPRTMMPFKGANAGHPYLLESMQRETSMGFENELSSQPSPLPVRLKRLRRATDLTPVQPKPSGRQHKRHRRMDYGNPFLDVEAQRSDDEFDTDDGEEEEHLEEEQSFEDSFINDTSSLFSNTSHGEDGSIHYRQDSMAIYRTSLFSPETARLRKVMGLH